MRKIGLILIMVAVLILLLTTDFPEAFPIEALAVLGVCIFVLGLLMIVEGCYLEKGSVPEMRNPPAPPQRKRIIGDSPEHIEKLRNEFNEWLDKSEATKRRIG